MSTRVLFNATNGETLEPCDRDVYKLGEVVVVSPLGKDTTEFVVREMRSAGFRADWHYHRNRIVVKVVGSVEEARAAWWEIVHKNKCNSNWLV